MKCRRKECQDCPYQDCIWEPRNRKPRTAEQVKRADELQRMKRRERAESGRCTYCGRPLPDRNFKLCAVCRMRRREYERERRIQMGVFPRTEGICWRCNKRPVLQGKRYCKVCYEKQVTIAMKNLEKAREYRPGRKNKNGKEQSG